MTEENLNTIVPASITDRQLLVALIKEAAGYLDHIDELKFQLKEVVDTASDKDGKLAIASSDFNALVKAYREKEKIEKDIAKKQSALDDISVLIK